MDKAALASGFGNLMRFLQAKSELTKKEFLTAADPRILKKIADKSTKLDACYENSRNLTGVNLDDTSINFCR